MKKILVILSVSLTLSACTTLNVKRISSNMPVLKKSGFYYNLPKTLINIDVSANKIYKIRGPYATYAMKYLGIGNVITTNSVTYEVSSVSISSMPVPDTSNYFFIETGSGRTNKQPILLQFSESGYLTNVNTQSEEIREQKDKISDGVLLKDGFDDNSNFSVNSNIAEKIDTIIEKVNLDTTVIEKKVLKKVFVEKTIEQKAKEAADYIMRVKEARYNLLNGITEVNYSKEAINFMLDELSKAEKEYLNLFTGITVTKTFSSRYSYCPAISGLNSEVLLCRFSPSEGLLDTTRFIGKDITLVITASSDTKGISEIINKKSSFKLKSHGLYYRIPEYAEVSVKVGNERKAKERMLINQWGVVAEMPYSKGMQITLYPNTGALKMVKSK